MAFRKEKINLQKYVMGVNAMQIFNCLKFL